MFVVVSSRVQTDWTCGRTGPALPPPPAPIGPAATTSATVTSPAATFPWPSPTQQNLLQKLTSTRQCPPTQTISRLAGKRFCQFFCRSVGPRVSGGEVRNVACGVRRSWLLAIQGDDITRAAHRAVYRCAYLSPPTPAPPCQQPPKHTDNLFSSPAAPCYAALLPAQPWVLRSAPFKG